MKKIALSDTALSPTVIALNGSEKCMFFVSFFGRDNTPLSIGETSRTTRKRLKIFSNFTTLLLRNALFM